MSVASRGNTGFTRSSPLNAKIGQCTYPGNVCSSDMAGIVAR